MARRTRTRYRTRVKRVYSRSRSFGGVKTKQILDGVLAGAAETFATRYLGAWGEPAALIGVGWFRRNTTLSTLGGIEIGQMIGGMVGGGGATTGGSFYQS